ncbi:hypothetical protein KIW84_056614 [Lathyrus oleraceus]|uniref:Uncharacterized protein n=1 Tax=Pisum sativum TaxID=3888 RepID=A0A9D5ALN0_PEA|nr:hypothetical protein KIW84_056614 [Pisum sativum]
MARLNSALLITLLFLIMHSSPSSIDARKTLKMDTQEFPSSKGTLPLTDAINNLNIYRNGRLVARLANNGRVLVSSVPSPGESMIDPNWHRAMVEEMTALDLNNIWNIVTLPPHKTTMGYQWVYTVKVGSDG